MCPPSKPSAPAQPAPPTAAELAAAEAKAEEDALVAKKEAQSESRINARQRSINRTSNIFGPSGIAGIFDSLGSRFRKPRVKTPLEELVPKVEETPVVNKKKLTGTFNLGRKDEERDKANDREPTRTSRSSRGGRAVRTSRGFVIR